MSLSSPPAAWSLSWNTTDSSSAGVLAENPAIAAAGMRASIEKPLGWSESPATTRAGSLRRGFAIALPGNTSSFVGAPPAATLIST